MEFLPSSTATEVMEIIRNKIGLEENSRGYAIYEVLGNTERCLLPEEKITDIMSKWEKYRYATDQELLNTVCVLAKINIDFLNSRNKAIVFISST